MDFGRVITAMVTPFDRNLQVSWEQTKTLIDYLIEEQQNDAIIISGTTGESPTLTDEEKLELFSLAVRHANGRCKVLAGTGSNDTNHTIELTVKAEKTGVDGILLVSPYYNIPSQEGLYEHYKRVAQATSLPVMLYNVPKRTGVNVSAQTTIRLSEIDNIVASKESTGDLDAATEIVTQTSDDFYVFSGDDALTLPLLSVGAHGIVSVASHLVGREIKQMIEAYESGRVVEARELHGRLLPLFKALFVSPNPVLIKAALNMVGVDVGGVRLPLVQAPEDQLQQLRSLLVEFNLL